MNLSREDSAVAALLQQAEAYHRDGDLEAALRHYRHVLAIRPDDVEALQGAGIVCGRGGHFEKARDFFSAACAAQPDKVAAHFNRAKALQALADLPGALAGYGRAIALNPTFAEAYNNRGNVLKDLACHQEALADFDRANALRPDLLAASVNRGVALMGLGRHEEALENYRRLLAVRADIAELWNNGGNALKALGHLEDAAAYYRRAALLRPDYPNAWHNLGIVRKLLGEFDQAVAAHERVIALKPDHAEARFDLGLLKLLLGDYQQGWPLHEWRWKAGGERQVSCQPPQRLWLGDAPLAGRTILLHSEQGMGDVIQFVRYAPMVVAQGAKVLLAAPNALTTLLRSLRCEFTLLDGDRPVPQFDLHCPLMSLPLAFKTRIDVIPAQVPYLSADAVRRQRWRERLGNKRRPRIGLVWSGNPRHRNDQQRSLPLHLLAPLLTLDFEFHALYSTVREEDRTALERWPQLIRHEHDLADFADTAALIAELDRVISADTAVAHLAGAMGAPVWILLPFVPDFRWLTGRSDSPWYPTARLFRQHRRGDWPGVVEEVRRALLNPMHI